MGGGPRAAAATAGGSPRPATGRQTHGGGRRGTAVVPAVGDGARRIACSEPRIRPGGEPRMSWTNNHDKTVHKVVHVLPCTCGGNIPKEPLNPYRKGRPWDPSVVATSDTR